jgi:nicotinamide-nucleotide amidase
MGTEILTTFGISASAVTETLRDFDRRFPQIRLEVRDVFPEVHLHLRPRQNSAKIIEDALRRAIDWIRQQLGAHLLSAQGKPLEAVVGELLKRLQASVAVAESCTGGLISHLLTNVSGSSDYFLMAAVTYANSAKQQLLGVSEKTLRSCGAVHESTAAEMAAGIRRICGASYGLATTGIAGPAGGSREKPVGTLCVGLAGPEGVDSRRFFFSFPDRLMNKKIFAATALDLLRRNMLTRLTAPDRDGVLCAGKPDPAAI